MARSSGQAQLTGDFAKIEKDLGRRLGVCVLDLSTGRQNEHRGSERFPMCSTFKALATAAVLARVDAGRDRLDRVVRFAAGELVEYSPVTQTRVDQGMNLEEISEAAITRSDNTAANLLLEALGGPSAITRFAHSLGDRVTRLDRTETSLNEAAPGDVRDTTSPAAMAANLRKLVLGRVLLPYSRELLASWLVANQTGGTRLLAGLPPE